MHESFDYKMSVYSLISRFETNRRGGSASTGSTGARWVRPVFTGRFEPAP